MDDTQADIEIFEKAIIKHAKCDQSDMIFGQKACKIFHHQFDTSFDLLARCGCCRFNTSEPTNLNKNVRFS